MFCLRMSLIKTLSLENRTAETDNKSHSLLIPVVFKSRKSDREIETTTSDTGFPMQVHVLNSILTAVINTVLDVYLTKFIIHLLMI